MPKAKDGLHLAGGPEHDELPGKIASLIANLVDSCLVGVYLQAALTGVSPTPPKAVGANKRGGSLASGPTVGSSRRLKRDGDKLYDTQDWRYGVAVSTADVLGAVKTNWENVPVGTMDACTQKTQAVSSAPPKVVTPLFAVSVNDDYIEPEGPDRENSADGKPLPKA